MMEKDCQQCLELLPWYVNGSLPATQAQQVFKHLERCPHCMAEQQFLTDLRQHVREHDAPTPASDWSGLWPSLNTPSKTPKRDWKWSMMPALAAVVVCAVFIARSPQPLEQPALYRLMTSGAASDASNPHVARPAADQERMLRLLLINGHDEQLASQLFSSIDAEIVTGPSPRGVYTVALRRGVSDKNAFIEALRENKQIDFAEWVETP
jgi:hypothetical protein